MELMPEGAMKMLIVDDNQSITQMLTDMLDTEHNYEIEVASDGYQAMHKMLSFNPALVILDLSMPGMSGQDTLIKIKEINPNTKVIIASAHDDDQTKSFCLKHGASDYITKPYDTIDVLNKVKNVLGGSKYGPTENIFFSRINEKLRKNFEGVFGRNQLIEFQTAQLKKYPKIQNTSSRGMANHESNSTIPTFEIPHEQRGFTTEISGHVTGSIISVVPDKFIEIVENYSGEGRGIEKPDGLMEFFNILNGAVLSATGNFLHVQINSSPIRPYDIQKDKTISGMDLMEISYTFELEGKSTWFTVYLWMNIFESFEEKLDGLFAK